MSDAQQLYDILEKTAQDVELAEFLVDTQKPRNVVRHMTRDNQKARLYCGLIYVVHFHDPGRYAFNARFAQLPENDIKITGVSNGPASAIFYPYIETHEIEKVSETETMYLLKPTLLIAPFDSSEAYDIALRLLEKKQDIWEDDGMMELAGRFKTKKDSLGETDITDLL